MLAADLGDPCLPFKSAYDVGGDLRTNAMTELFRVCHENLGDAWAKKKQIYRCVHKEAPSTNDDDGNDGLSNGSALLKKLRTSAAIKQSSGSFFACSRTASLEASGSL